MYTFLECTNSDVHKHILIYSQTYIKNTHVYMHCKQTHTYKVVTHLHTKYFSICLSVSLLVYQLLPNASMYQAQTLGDYSLSCNF